MSELDQMCQCKTPSMCATVFPFGGFHFVKFNWRTKEVLVLVCTFIKEPWPCDGGWHKTRLHPPSESVDVCSTTSLCQGFIAQDLSHMFPRLVPLVDKENLNSRYFLLISMSSSWSLRCTWRQDSSCFGRGRCARMEPVESGNITKPAMVCWHFYVVWWLRFS